MSSDGAQAFPDLVELDCKITMLLDVAEATWALNEVVARHGARLPLVPGDLPIRVMWRRAFSTPLDGTAS